MPATQTLAQLRTRIRFDGDFENSRVISDARLLEVINASAREVWDWYAEKRRDLLITEQSGPPAMVPNTATVALASNLYRLEQVEILDGGQYYRVHPVNVHEAWRFNTSWASPRGFRYRVQANNLVFVPTPKAAYTLRVYYIPTLTALSADGDTFDGINGFEDLLIVRSILRLLRREKMPTAEFVAEAERVERRVMAAAEQLDVGQPFFLSGTGPEGPPDDDYWWVP